jgi:hypothetical protein
MEIVYITEPDAPFPYEAWDALNSYISGTYSGLTTEALAMEGYKETLRHLWEKLVEYLKKIVSWVKEKTMSDKRRLEQTREQVEKVLGELHALQVHRAPLDHVAVPMSAAEYRQLAKTPHDKVDMRMVGEAYRDMQRVMTLFFESHVDYVKAQVGLIVETYGGFDVLQADEQLAQLKAKLAGLPFKGFGVDETHIPIVGMSEIVLDKTSHPGMDELAIVVMKMSVSSPTAGFRAPNVGAAIAIMVNLREALNRAIKFHEVILPDLETTHKKLVSGGGMLLKRVNEIVDGNTDGNHITAIVKEMLAIEAKVAGSVLRPIVPAVGWMCTTSHAVSSLITRCVEAAQHQEAPKPGSVMPALPAPQ